MRRVFAVSLGALTAALVFALGCEESIAAAPVPVVAAQAVAPPAAAPPAAAPARTVAGMPSLAPLVKELRPAVVNIYTSQKARAARGFRGRGQLDPDVEDFMERFFGGGQGDQDRQALGSGFLIGDALALTNNHVIDGADEIKVKLADGREFAAKVIGRDANTDVALLKLEGEGSDKLDHVPLGDSDAIEVGDYVVAIGNPFGLQHTVTAGIVSAKARNIGAGPYDDFIQTDASINPGNSGGPLFNLQGEVVGINTAIVARGQGIGFAVPANLVKELLPQLREHGKVTRGWLGVALQEVTPELANSFGLAEGKGALISQAIAGSPASRAGIVAGDVVVEVNGKVVDSPGGLSRAIAAIQPGEEARLRLIRNGKEQVVVVKLTERDDERALTGDLRGAPTLRPDTKVEASVGVRVAPLPPELARRLSLRTDEALLVSAVLPDSVAAAAGVQANDVLLELNRTPTGSVDAFQKAARDLKPGDTVLFRVRRGNGALYLAARLPRP